jgi:hypothetical protein
MLLGGPEYWSSTTARVPARRVRNLPFSPWLGPAFLAVVAAGAILVAEPAARRMPVSAQQSQRASLGVTAIVRAEPASRVRLPIQVGPPGNVAKNSFIRIRGLPPMAALSDGHSISPGTWAVPLVALPNLSIILPAGTKGESTVAISLVGIDGELLAEATMVLAIAPAAVVTPQAAPPASNGPAALPASSAERERAQGLHAKGIEQLERGNIHAARKFFEHATAAGLAQSAVALAATYDPDELAKIKIVGLQPDIAMARKWYEKARELGAAEASERLRRLGAR